VQHESRLHYGYDVDGVLMPSGPQKISFSSELMWFAQLNGSRSNNEVFEGSLWGFPRPEGRKDTRSLSESLDPR